MAVLDVGYDVERCVKVPVAFSLSTNILGKVDSRALEASLPCSPYFLSVMFRHTSCSLANFLSRPMYKCTGGCLVEGGLSCFQIATLTLSAANVPSGHYFNVLFTGGHLFDVWTFLCRVHGNWLRSRMGQQGDFRQGVDLRHDGMRSTVLCGVRLSGIAQGPQGKFQQVKDLRASKQHQRADVSVTW